VGSIAATRTLNDLSAAALQELELAIGLFENAATHPVARNGLPILLRLRRKATSKLPPAIAHGSSTTTVAPISTTTEEVDEALSMIGGTKHVLKEERRQANGSNSSTPSTTNRNLSDNNINAQLVANAVKTNTPSIPPSTQIGPGAHSAEWPLHSGHAPSVYTVPTPNDVDNLQNGIPAPQFFNNLPTSVPADWEYPSAFYSNPTHSFGVGMQETTRDPSSSRYELPPVTSSTDRLREYAHLGPAGFPMNVDTSSHDFDVRGISGMAYFADAVTNARAPNDDDAIIEDAWRNILEDARLSTSGFNDQMYY